MEKPTHLEILTSASVVMRAQEGRETGEGAVAIAAEIENEIDHDSLGARRERVEERVDAIGWMQNKRERENREKTQR